MMPGRSLPTGSDKQSDARRLQIAVIGPSRCTDKEYGEACTAGEEIAREGAILVSGGLGGVMEASCRGARAACGIAVGIVPGISAGNPFLTTTVRTGLGHARNILVVQSADAVVALGGAGSSFGTLSEIGIALTCGKPVFGWKTWDIPGVVQCDTAEEAVQRAVRASRQ
jgi:uncharacterized protein (TIGR00725 family)